MENRGSEKKMVNHERSVFYRGGYWRLASIGVFCFACLISQDGVCSSSYCNTPNTQITDLLNPLNATSSRSAIDEFQNLHHRCKLSQDPVGEARQFFQSFVTELNERYGLNMTVLDVCKMVRENIRIFSIPPEMQECFLETICLLEIDSTQSIHESNIFTSQVGMILWWPKLFKSNGDKNRKNHSKTHKENVHLMSAHINEEGLPGRLTLNTLIGFIETAVGASCVLVGGATGLGAVVGSVLLADGIHRIAEDGLKDIQEAMRDRNQSRYADD